MHEVETSPITTDMDDAGTRDVGGIRDIRGLDALREHFPDYSGTVTFDSVDSGVTEDHEMAPWTDAAFEIDKSLVIGRLAESHDNCIILSADTEEGYEELAPLTPESFGGDVIGILENVSYGDSVHVTVRSPQYLVVLYSAALQITIYEKDLSNRVLNGVTGTPVNALKRKYMKQKRELKNKVMRKSHHSDSITVSLKHIDAYRISLGDTEGISSFYEK